MTYPVHSQTTKNLEISTITTTASQTVRNKTNYSKNTFIRSSVIRYTKQFQTLTTNCALFLNTDYDVIISIIKRHIQTRLHREVHTHRMLSTIVRHFINIDQSRITKKMIGKLIVAKYVLQVVFSALHPQGQRVLERQP